MKKPQSFSCEESDWEALEEPARKLGFSRNVLIQKLVDNFLETGEINPQNQPNQSLKELQKEKLQFELSEKKDWQSLKKEKLEAEVRIKKSLATYYETFRKPPSKKANDAMGHHVNQTTPLDEDSIRCPDCANWQSNSKHPIEWQIDALTKHVKNFHNRPFTPSEADELAGLIK